MDVSLRDIAGVIGRIDRENMPMWWRKDRTKDICGCVGALADKNCLE